MSVKITSDYISTPNIIDIRQYSTLSEALTLIGSNEVTLLIAEPFTVEENATVPENICLKFTKGGKLVISAGYTVTINGGIEAGLWQIFDGDGKVTGSPKIEAVYPEWFGAVGNGVTDDTSAFNKAIDFAKTCNFAKVELSEAVYVVSSTLSPLNNSFNSISIVGRGRSTTIDGSAIGSEVPIFQLVGGSGVVTLGYIQDLTIKGSGAEIGIENKGCCGFKFYRVTFKGLKYGIVFSNDIAAGTFTEYSVAEECSFESDVETAVFYKRGAGDPSFHGSGLRKCTINNGDTITAPSIRIGDAIDTGIVLYNAPLDFQVWTRNTYNIIEANASLITTYGTITIERFNGTPTLCSGTTIHHAGDVLLWGSTEGVKLGDFVLCDRLWTNSDGSINAFEKTTNYYAETNANESVTLCKVDEEGSLIFVHLISNNYDKKYLICAHKDNYGGVGDAGFFHETVTAFGSGSAVASSTVDTTIHEFFLSQPAILQRIDAYFQSAFAQYNTADSAEILILKGTSEVASLSLTPGSKYNASWVNVDLSTGTYQIVIRVTSAGTTAATPPQSGNITLRLVHPYITLNSFDVAGLGDPTFSIDSAGNLIVSNPNWATTAVNVSIRVVKIGTMRTPYFNNFVQQ